MGKKSKFLCNKTRHNKVNKKTKFLILIISIKRFKELLPKIHYYKVKFHHN